MLRASIAAEAAGVPSVSIVCEGFEGQALATGRGMGFDDMPLAVLTGHVDAQSADAMIASFLDHTVDQIVDALLNGAGDTSKTGASDRHSTDAGADTVDRVHEEHGSLDVVATGALDEINDVFVEHGWSDGSPIIPPTVARVEAFLEPLGHDPWRVIGRARPSGRDMTIWSVAVNAVMAGCRPEQLPVLLAIADVLANPAYGVEHSGNTTGADALIVLSGPIGAELGFNSGAGALRDGSPANTTVGRWLRLYLRNVHGFTVDEHDKATFGNTFRVVLAEDDQTLAALGWPDLAADLGVDGDRSAVSIARMNSGAIVGSVVGSTPEEILPYLGDGLARISGWDLTHVHGIGRAQFAPLIVLSPILASIFANAGWSKERVKEGLFEHARIPAWRFEKLIGEWSNLTPGRRKLVELVVEGAIPADFAASDDPQRLVPIVTEPSKIQIAVAGDPNRTNAYVFSNDGPHGDWTSAPIDDTPSLDLVCEIES